MKLFKKWRYWWLALVFFAVLYRFEFNSHFVHTISNDTHFYDESAINIVTGKGYSWWDGEKLLPVSHHTPGYSLFLALIYAFVSVSEPLTQIAPRIQAVVAVQHALSLVTAWLYVLCLSAFGAPIWLLLVFGLVMMGFVPFMVFSSLLLPETLSLFMVAVFLWGLFYLKKQSNAWPFWWGLWLGLLMLVKPYFIYFPLAYGLWILAADVHNKRKLVNLGLAILGVLLVVGGWLGFVRLQAGIWVPMQRGYTFVVQQSECPPTLCQANGTLIQKENVATPEKIEDRLPVGVFEWVWWRTVHKWREYWGFIPEIPRLIKDTVSGMSFLHTAVMGVYLTAWTAALISLLYIRTRNYNRLLLWFLVGGAFVVHSYLWSLPRYGLAMVPVVLLLGFSVIPRLMTMTGNVSCKRTWKTKAALASWPISLIIFGRMWDGSTLSITLFTIVYLVGISVFFWLRLCRAKRRRIPVASLLLAGWMTLMVIVLLPLYFSILLPSFRWEHLPYPFVTRIGEVIIK
jgi:4-amino-4-deoxy-L-arabinose transferase-like glycosyltransferase